MAAGFEDFKVTWRGDVYSGAKQASNAALLGTLGVDFTARKCARPGYRVRSRGLR